jgi:hypothetical protein
MRKDVEGIIRALEIDDHFAEDLRCKTLESCDSKENARILLGELEHDNKEDKHGNNNALYAIFESCAYDILEDKEAAFKAAQKAVSGFRKCGNCFNEGLFNWYRGLLFQEYQENHLAIPQLTEAIRLLKRCAETYEAESKFALKKRSESYIQNIAYTLQLLDGGQTSPPPPPRAPSVVTVVSDVLKKFLARLTYGVYDVGHASRVGKFVLDDSIISKVEIDRVIIENDPYRIYNCRGGAEVKITSNGDFRWIKVAGQSMNQAKPVPIDPADYVLIDVNLPREFGQIVFASLSKPPTPEERAGVIKRYSQSGYKSESTENIDSIPLEDAVVRGVVIAVAKKDPA